MNRLETVGIIGLGALGAMYAQRLSENLPTGAVRVVVDQARRERYQREGVFANGVKIQYSYITPEEHPAPVDLLIIATKYHHLAAAMETAASVVGENTLIISAINGIVSERDIGARFGERHVVHCVAQGADAVKVGNQLTYKATGKLCVGEPGGSGEKTRLVADLLTRGNMPNETPPDILHRLWSKWMMNCGINQVTGVLQVGYGGVQQEGVARERMIAAMDEVRLLSNAAGVALTKEDIPYWLDMISTLDPAGETSMCQDIRARRKTEVELFAGTVLEMAPRYNIATPVNSALYNEILALERSFGVRD